MSDIYQTLWSIDQAGNGLPPILSGQAGDTAVGFVEVDPNWATSTDPDFQLMPNVEIPASKAATYELCRKLFNNYALPERDEETDTPQERTERHNFVEAIIATDVMEAARDYIATQTGEAISAERWHNVLMDHWFRPFSQGGDPALTGFEHVIVGEQEKGKVQGYHFWYKYFLDDGFARSIDDGLPNTASLPDDRITFGKSRGSAQQATFPESVTMQFRWDAPDYERGGALRPLFKKIGGFFVGCSVEGLMALGTVRAHLGADAPKNAIIEGAEYQMKLFTSSNGRHIRTFYPVFKGAVDTVPSNPQPIPPSGPTTPAVAPATDGDVRIIAMLVNPEGADPGSETVTLAHVGPGSLTLDGWLLRDRNGKTTALDGLTLRPGYPETLTLDGQGIQLSNKGSVIEVVNASGQTVHRAEYARARAKGENRTLLFG